MLDLAKITPKPPLPRDLTPSPSPQRPHPVPLPPETSARPSLPLSPETSPGPSLSPQVSKPVCTGTRAIVRALPSGRPSTEVWRQVVQHQSSRPVRELVWGVLVRLRAEGERLNVCRGMRRFVGVKHLKVGCGGNTLQTHAVDAHTFTCTHSHAHIPRS